MTANPSSPRDPRGRDTTSPLAMPAAGWKDVIVRTFRETGRDNIGLIAAGVAFYAFLSIVPLLGAMVLSYGLIAEPATVLRDIRALTEVMPADAARLIGEQLLNVVETSGGKKGFGLVLALGLAFYGAMKAATAVVTALNIAYEQEEARGFVRLNALALAITAGAVMTAIAAMTGITALGYLESLFPQLPAPLLGLGKLLSYTALGAVTAAATATLYRYGPDRDHARWRWLSPGSLLTTLLWLALTWGFGVYVANFGNYDATYGSLGAVVVLLTWIWLSAYALLLGAELNSELERQTVRDTTRGPEKAMGLRGATVADTVADADPDVAVPQAGTGQAMASAGIARGVAGIMAGRSAGIVPAMLVMTGLRCVGQPRRAGAGVLLMMVGGGLAWRGRRR